MTRATIAAALGALLLAPLAAPAAEWYVAPQGSATASGSKEHPWDIDSTLGGKLKVAPGDTVWLLGGTYKYPFRKAGMGFPVHLAGREDAPIRVRAVAGQRATIDGGLVVGGPATYLWLQDLEILVSEPRPEKPVSAGSHPGDLNRPWGGLNIDSGAGGKYINLVIHDNCQGVSFWLGARDSELHGCLIYDNGWRGTDRGHGHAVYTQNNDGTKTISDCIMTGGFGYTMHAYGSGKAYVNNYLAEGNICYNANLFLIGGGRPSTHIRVLGNCLHGVGMQIGYTAGNEDCEVRNNLIVNGDLNIKKFKTVVNDANTILAKDAERPKGSKVVLRPNKYDPQRANLAVFNWEKKTEIEVDAGTFLKTGDRYRVLDPRDFFGKPVLAGAADGKPIRVPMTGEFAAFVLLKEEK